MKANDVIVKFDGQNTNTVAELQEQVGKHRPGDKASVTYIRNGKESTIPITLKNVAGNTKVVTAEMGSSEDVVFGAKLAPLTTDHSVQQKQKLSTTQSLMLDSARGDTTTVRLTHCREPCTGTADNVSISPLISLITHAMQEKSSCCCCCCCCCGRSSTQH